MTRVGDSTHGIEASQDHDDKQKREERREEREERREKKEDTPQEAARGPQMKPPWEEGEEERDKREYIMSRVGDSTHEIEEVSPCEVHSGRREERFRTYPAERDVGREQRKER